MGITEEQKAMLESPEMQEYIQKQIESMTDKTVQQYEQQIRDKEKELQKLKLETMSEEERLKAEREMHQKEIERLEQQVNAARLDKFATDTLQQFGLSLDYKKLIMGANELEITQKARELSRIASAQRQYQQITPLQGQNVRNPFAKDTFNLTEQGKLLRDNPQLARQLAAQVGYDLTQFGL